MFSGTEQMWGASRSGRDTAAPKGSTLTIITRGSCPLRGHGPTLKLADIRSLREMPSRVPGHPRVIGYPQVFDISGSISFHISREPF